jgi:hypothetical protein
VNNKTIRHTCFKGKKLRFKRIWCILRQTDISNINDYVFVQLKAPMISLTSKFTIKKILQWIKGIW